MVQWRELQNLKTQTVGQTTYQSKPGKSLYLPWIIFSSTNEDSESSVFVRSSKMHAEVLWNCYVHPSYFSFQPGPISFSDPQKSLPTVPYCCNLCCVLSLSLTWKPLKWLVHICVLQPRITGSHAFSEWINELTSEWMDSFPMVRSKNVK